MWSRLISWGGFIAISSLQEEKTRNSNKKLQIVLFIEEISIDVLSFQK
jgi:hypothetical protein